MTELERAEAYASIFANVGDRWHRFVPVDAVVTRLEGLERVRLGEFTLERVEDGWRLFEPGRSWLVRAKARPA